MGCHLVSPTNHFWTKEGIFMLYYKPPHAFTHIFYHW
jgi:hypothetical protein